MDIVAVGSVALDTIHTPVSSHQELLGGSASYFSLAARHFASVGVVAVVGEDFPAEHIDLLRGRGVDLGGFEKRAGTTFRWEGRYALDPNQRETILTELGVFSDFHPVLPETYLGSSALFLANIDPKLQLEVLDNAGKLELIAVDTMNFWIEGQLDVVKQVIAGADLLIINDEEAHLLTGLTNPIEAARQIRGMGPEVVVIKKGAHGATALGPWGWLLFPAFPVESVQDPTGAGDSFAGGLIGYLAGKEWRNRDRFAEGLAVATAMASIVVEQFGVAAIREDQSKQLRERIVYLRDAMKFDTPQGI
jgi:sugar/nucleoside kinase (ribokinase family)